MILKLSSEQRNKLIHEIQNFFYEERGEEIGIIGAEVVLEFFTEHLGTFIYNKSLDDAKLWFKQKMENIEVDFDLLYK